MWLDKLQKTEALYNAYVDNYNKLQELYEANDELASYDLETYYTQVCDEPSVVETRELERAILSEKVSVQSYLQRRVKDAQSLLDQLKKDTSRTVMFINSFVTSFFSTSRFGLVVAGGFVVVLFVLLNCCSGMSTASEVASKKHLLSIAFFTLVICFIVGCIFWPIIQGGPVSYTHLTLPTKRIV